MPLSSLLWNTMRPKPRFLLAVLLLTQYATHGQQYWQQQLRYSIDVTLNDKEHSLDGFLKLSYSNHSPDTLPFIWFHLWPNAYKNDRTAFSEQLLENGRTEFYFSEKQQRGYINQLDFRVQQTTCKVEDHPQYIDIVKVILPSPLLPGDSIMITTPFHVQLPDNFSRSGYHSGTYMIAQWYPKPAVYDRDGWHPMPYLDQGEFYSEFGEYQVQITLPEKYIVAAPGSLSDTAEKERMLQKVRYTTTPITKPLKKPAKTRSNPIARTNGKSKTLHYHLAQATDFAWFADTSFWMDHDTLRMKDGKSIELYSFYPPSQNEKWKNSIRLMKEALRFRSGQLGEYPYATMSAVHVPMGFSGGMEYPAITAISSISDEKSLAMVLQHEIGHNWFQAAIGSNEREHPWMDEGLNTFYDRRYEKEKYPQKNNAGNLFTENHLNELLLGTITALRKDQPIATSASAFSPINYQMIAYYKTARWLEQVETALGTTLFDSCMRNYYQKWKFRHPQPSDLLNEMAQLSGRPAAFFNDALNGLHSPSYFTAGKKKIRPHFGWKPTSQPNEIPVSILPVPGYNLYDGFMIGISIANYNLPPSPFRFLLAPQYATRSNKWNGMARFSYDHFPKKNSLRIQWSLTAMQYSDRSGTDSTGKRIHGRFHKLTPAVRIWFNEASPRSTRERWLEARSYLIGERGFDFVKRSSDSFFFPSLSTTRTRYIHQLTYRMTDFRALYPYELQWQWQQGKDFYRINISGQYFFNYASGGGLSIRAFAAKFGYIGRKDPLKEFYTSVYQPKLTAVRGNEDYTYANTFLGRNESEGLWSQQILMRDGDLKIRTDLFSGLQGRSDDWIAAANFNTTLPASVLPSFIPVRLFLDVGTHAGAWEKSNEDPRFLFVGGIQLSLMKNCLNLYVPLLYSKVFADNFKSVPGENKLLRKISFSIDIQRLQLRRLSNNQLPF